MCRSPPLDQGLIGLQLRLGAGGATVRYLTLDALEANQAAHPQVPLPAAAATSPAAIPERTNGLLPWETSLVGTASQASPLAGLVPMRNDFGVVRHSQFLPNQQHQWNLPVQHTYAAPQTVLPLAPAPSPRDNAAFPPMQSATRHTLRVADHVYAQELPKPDVPPPGRPTVRSRTLQNFGPVARYIGGGDNRLRVPPPLPHEPGTRTSGCLWPPPALAPPQAYLANLQLTFLPERMNASLSPTGLSGSSGSSGSTGSTGSSGSSGASPAALPQRLRISGYDGTLLPWASLAERGDAVQGLLVDACPQLLSLHGLHATFPQLRRLVVDDCPALRDLGPNLLEMAESLDSCIITRCPALASDLQALDGIRHRLSPRL